MCQFDGCEKPVRTRGYCVAHYAQLRTGKLLKPLRIWPERPALCTFPGCENPWSEKGYCSAHARQLRSGQAVLAPLKKRQFSIMDRLEVYVRPEGECLVWTSIINMKGYGFISVGDGTKRYVHRVAYERKNGPISKGLVLHHTCFNPLCINPDHLIPMTIAQHNKLHKALFKVLR